MLMASKYALKFVKNERDLNLAIQSFPVQYRTDAIEHKILHFNYQTVIHIQICCTPIIKVARQIPIQI